MIEDNKFDVIYGIQIIPETYCTLFVPKMTKKEKFIRFKESILGLLKDFMWAALFTIGLSLQMAGLAYIAGIMFIRGAS